MALEPKDRAMLVKLLGMTGSDQDGEALNAVRMATALLKRCKVTWAEALGASAAGSQRPEPQPQYRYRPSPSQRADPFEDMIRKAGLGGNIDLAALWAELMRGAGLDPDREPNPFADSRKARDAGGDAWAEEKRNVALARLRLDELLKRKNVPDLKRAHFEAIRSHHQQTGHINVAHRAQIDRAYYTSGWDEPLRG